ncbi:MAG TPA: ATP-binding protein [Verrucomicrobiae bacterium]
MLRRRLLLHLLPFVAMLVGTGLYAMMLFSRLTTTVDTAVARNYRSVVTAQQMLLALAEFDREAWAGGAVEGRDRKLSEHRKRFEAGLEIQLGNTSQPGEKELNEQLAADYQALTNALGSIRSARDAESRHRFYEQQFTPNLLRMKLVLDKILRLNQRAILATSGKIRDITRDMRRLMVTGLVVALAISIYASYQLSRFVLRPIQQVTRATRGLGEGNLDQTVPVLSRDELGELAVAFNRLAAQLREYRQSTTDEIVRLHRTMETTLASFPDPIFVLNKEARIELSNPAAGALAMCLKLEGCLPDRLQTIAQRTLASGENYLPHSFDAVVCYRVEGAEKFFLPRVLTMRDKQDALFGVAVVLYDVTRFRLLDAAKNDLVATVSHELKSPLTSVRMALHILLERTVGALSPKQEDLVQTARNDTERLLRILNDLLDLARLEGGNAELHRENVTPAELVEEIVSGAAESVAAKGLRLATVVEPGLPAVSVDRQRISHVFSNLISNAIKHSPPGGQILIRAEPAEDHSVQFSVCDEGPGIPERYHTRVFERFFRVPGQARHGAGLGLSIAREITVAHRGRIGVHSAPGRGAALYVVLAASEAT